MTKIQSNSDRITGKAKNFFVPSFAGGLLYFIIGSLLLVAYNSHQLISWFGNDYLQTSHKLSLNINILNNGFSSSFSAAFGGRLGLVIVWSLVGALSYMGLWFLKNILNSFENDVIIDHYLHPSNYNRAGYWGSAMAGKIFFGAMVIILIAYSIVTLKVIMPAAAALTSSAINDFHILTSIEYILICLVISAIAIYFWILLLRLFAHLWKLL